MNRVRLAAELGSLEREEPASTAEAVLGPEDPGAPPSPSGPVEGPTPAPSAPAPAQEALDV